MIGVILPQEAFPGHPRLIPLLCPAAPVTVLPTGVVFISRLGAEGRARIWFTIVSKGPGPHLENIYELQSTEQRTEKAMATHSSALAWKIPWTEEPGRLQSMGSLGVRHD